MQKPSKFLLVIYQQLTLSFGDPNPVNIAVQLSLEDDAFFVYGKSCSDSICKKTKVNSVFDETVYSKGKQPTTFNYGGSGSYASGTNYMDKVGYGDRTFNQLFGVADQGNNDTDLVNADGYLGIGFMSSNGSPYNLLTNLFNADLPNKALTIWQNDKSGSGAINVGSNTYPKCPKTSSPLYDVISNNNVNQWWFKADSVEVNGAVALSMIIKINLNSDTFELTSEQFKKVKGVVDNDNNVDDINKLPKIKITLDKDNVFELDGSTYSSVSGNKFKSLAVEHTTGGYHIQLGRGALKKLCVVLSQKTDNNFQMGLIYTKSFSPSSMAVSFFSLMIVPLVYAIGL